MAARASSSSLVLSLDQRHAVTSSSSSKPAVNTRGGAAFTGRRALVLTWTASVVVALPGNSKAEDIGLFGIRKKLKEAERETEVIVKEGIEAAEKGIEAAEKGIEAAEKGVETAETEIETVAGYGGLAQAGLVVGAEVVAVAVASSVVNGILGPES